jgi:hypothetical protein
VVTDRDRSVVCWIAAIGASRAQDVMARFGMGRTVVYRRLGDLVARRVLRAVRFSVAQSALLEESPIPSAGTAAGGLVGR